MDLENLRARLQEIADKHMMPAQRATAIVEFAPAGFTGWVEISGSDSGGVGGSGSTPDEMLRSCELMLSCRRAAASKMPYHEFGQRLTAAIEAELPDAVNPGNHENDTLVYFWHVNGRTAQLVQTTDEKKTIYLWANSMFYAWTIQELNDPHLEAARSIILQHLT